MNPNSTGNEMDNNLRPQNKSVPEHDDSWISKKNPWSEPYAQPVAVETWDPPFARGMDSDSVGRKILSRINDLMFGLNPENAVERARIFYTRLGLTRENWANFNHRFSDLVLNGKPHAVLQAALSLADNWLEGIKGLSDHQTTKTDVVHFLSLMVQEKDGRGRWHSYPRGNPVISARKSHCGWSDLTLGDSAAEILFQTLKNDLAQAMSGQGLIKMDEPWLSERGLCWDVEPASDSGFSVDIENHIELVEQEHTKGRLQVNIFTKDPREFLVRWTQVNGDVRLSLKGEGRNITVSAPEDIDGDQDAIIGMSVSDGEQEIYREISVTVKDRGLPNFAPVVTIEAPEFVNGGETFRAKLKGHDIDPADNDHLKYSWSVESRDGQIEYATGEGPEIEISTPDFFTNGKDTEKLLIRARVDDGHDENNFGESFKTAVVLATRIAPDQDRKTDGIEDVPIGLEVTPFLERVDDFFLMDRSGSMAGRDEETIRKLKRYLEAKYRTVKPEGLCHIRLAWFENKKTELTYDSGWFDASNSEERDRALAEFYDEVKKYTTHTFGGSETVWYSVWDITRGDPAAFAKGPAEKTTISIIMDGAVYDSSNQVSLPGDKHVFSPEDTINLLFEEGIELNVMLLPGGN